MREKILLSPRHVLTASWLIALVLGVIMTYLAMQLPHLEPKVRRYQDQQLQVLNQQGEWQTIQQLRWSGNDIPAESYLAVEEPDQIPTYSQYNLLMAQYTQMLQAAHNHQLIAVANGQEFTFKVEKRHLHNLPVRYWFQLGFGLIAIVIAGAIFAFGGYQPAVTAYLICAIFYFLYTSSASLYGTRQFLMDGDTFRLYSVINHYSTFFGATALAVLIWRSPRSIHKRSIAPIAYLVTFSLILVDQFQLVEQQVNYVYGISLLSYIVCVLIGIYQWSIFQHDPADRAAMRWIFLSYFIVLIAFSAGLMLPMLINKQVSASQGWMFGVLLLVNVGLGLGVVRYKIYELERWWFSIWAWFISGVSILLIDFILAVLLPISSEKSLFFAVALAGWLYFPIRQWVLNQINRKYELNADFWLPKILPILLNERSNVSHESAIHRQWPNILKQVFSPLHVSQSNDHIQISRIDESGQVLLVAPLNNTHASYRLHHASKGKRLFTKNDLNSLATLVHLTELSVGVAHARDYGAKLERERLARDIHDDLSAKLLTLLHKCPEHNRPIIQDTLNDLRNFLNQLEVEEILLEDALSEWRLENSMRFEPFDINFKWHSDISLAPDVCLVSNEYSHLRRILREVVTNSIKYMDIAVFDVGIYIDNHRRLHFDITSTGQFLPSLPSGGRGMRNIKSRLEIMQGQLKWDKQHDQFRLQFFVNLSNLNI